MAQGEQQRLAALGYPKQMVQVCGEPNIARTIRLLKAAHGGACDITVVARATVEWKALATSTGVSLRALPDTGDGILDGLRNSLAMWSKDAVTLVLLGDVVWTEAALQGGLTAEPRPLTFIGRSGPNTITGRPWPELFGLSIAPSAARRLLALLADKEAQRSDAWPGENGKLWSLVRTLRATRQIPMSMFEIDDATDDVDVPEDMEHLREHEAHFR